MEETNLVVPEGWSAYSEKNAEKVEPGPQTGEDEYHSQYVDPDGKYGAAKSDKPNVSSYGG